MTRSSRGVGKRTSDGMAPSSRKRWSLALRATNTSNLPVRPTFGSLEFHVNGKPSFAAGLAFGNGAREPGWDSLGPRQSVQTDRRLGESLLTKPGTYRIELVNPSTGRTLSHVTVRATL